MRSQLRLRWRLGRSHALLAIALVAFAGNRISHENDLVQRAQATTVAVRDSEVLALRAGRLLGRTAALDGLVADEETPSRHAEIVASDGARLAGSVLLSAVNSPSVVDHALRDAAPSYARGAGNSVVAASPIEVDSRVVGAAVVSEAIPSGAEGVFSFGVSTWLGLTVIAVAAIAGFFIAGRISRPIGTLTDNVRQLALGQLPRERAPGVHGTFPEIETLSAAVQGIAARDTRRTESDDERRASLRALSHRLSHQLRTPLSVLRLRVDDLADPSVTGDRRTALAGIVTEQIDRLDQLGQELAELDPARWELRHDRVDVAALISDVTRRHEPLARWGGISLEASARSRPELIVLGDANLLEDAVANVVQNAIKYTPRGGHITVTASLRAGAVVVAVRDTGPGISAAEWPEVVRPGVRGTAGAAAEGSGHGLGLVADAVERHGGHLELAETPGGGATVRLVLPPAGADLPPRL